MPEFLIIMKKRSTKEEFAAVIRTVRASHGTAPLRYPPRVMIGRGTTAIAAKIAAKKLKGVKALYVSNQEPFPLDLGEIESLRLDEKGSSAIHSWIVRHSTEYRTRKNPRASEGLRLSNCNTTAGGIATLSGTTPRMTGLITVGIIIVNGPNQHGVDITPEEGDKVKIEVQEGSFNLEHLAPSSASLKILPNFETVDLQLDPAQVTEETDWRDEAMRQLVNRTGIEAVDEYVEELKREHRSPKACVAFVTMYTLFTKDPVAYRPVGQRYCVLRYPRANDPSSWRDPDDLDMMFAHEVGHIFGGEDESSYSNPCLMSQNMAWKICEDTAELFQW